ncbi:MAG: 3-hydroxyisobutyrate dehydrogenase [bacterium]|nr:3-hydroxyisobutyrate dehydrogenase [bacterium]
MTKGIIGFIGLGHMGLPMAHNLQKAGYSLKGFDLNPETLEAAKKLGIPLSKTAFETAEGTDFVITMLPEGKHVRSVYLEEDRLLDRLPSGTFLIDCSTINVETARLVAEHARKAGHTMLDAPVSGGVIGAQAGALTFMVGGTESDFKKAHPLFKIMGKNIFHCGGSGTGQAAKVCNNLMLAVHMIGTSEGFLLAEKLDLDPAVLFQVASKSSGQSWSLTQYCPYPGFVETAPSNREYEPGFTSHMMRKDLGLAQTSADLTKSHLPLTQSALNLYDEFCKNGGDTKDFSGIIQYLRKKM